MSGLAIIIPARYGSSRFEGKPLALICGRPMIQHVYERGKMASVADRVIVATDDERILKTVEGFGGTAILTSQFHKSGTDRIAEVAGSIDSEWIINLQGDEPLIDPDVIDILGKEMMASPKENMFSLMRPLSNSAELLDPNAVKVVVDSMGYALYFSRAPIPYPKNCIKETKGLYQQYTPDHPCTNDTLIHCGIYGYRRDFLLSIPKMSPSVLEDVEGLEQLRILANGHKIRMVFTKYCSIGVDTPRDIEAVENIIMKQK